MSISKLAQFGTKHVAKGIGRLTQEVLESGSGSYVTTVEGRRMLDFTSGIGVTNLGRKSKHNISSFHLGYGQRHKSIDA